MTPPQSKPALLLAAHGTTDQAGVDAFAALAERVGQLAAADGTRVAGGFIELSEPPLREAVAGLAAASPGPHGRGPAHALRGRARQGRHPRRAGPRAHPSPRLDLDVRPSPRAPSDAHRPARHACRRLRPRRARRPPGRPRLHRPRRQRGRGQDGQAALGGPGLPAGRDRLRLAGPAGRGAGPGAVPPAGRAADRGGQVFPVPGRAAGPGGRTGRRLRRRAPGARHQVHRRIGRLRRDRRAGLRAVPRGAGRGHPDELRRVRVPDRDARVRAPRRRAPASP